MKFILLLLLCTCARVTGTRITLCTFNVLAPIFADPESYPDVVTQLLGTPSPRTAVVKSRLVSLAADAYLNGSNIPVSAFLLQETQISFVNSFFGSGGLNPNDWTVLVASNDPTYWASYYETDPEKLAAYPWMAQTGDHGNTVLLRNAHFSNVQHTVISTANTGGKANQVVATYSGKTLRITNVHFDSDTAGKRRRETESTFEQTPLTSGIIDIIGGDLNTNTDTGNIQLDMIAQGYTNAIYALGKKDRTQPYRQSYYSSLNWSSLDHFLIRSCSVLDGYIVNLGLWETYPIFITGDKDDNQDSRLAAALGPGGNGADHFPVVVTLEL
jgi:endonuclease/exonuclease/phosphatase family metal-dependent hydrolase